MVSVCAVLGRGGPAIQEGRGADDCIQRRGAVVDRPEQRGTHGLHPGTLRPEGGLPSHPSGPRTDERPKNCGVD